MAKPEERCEQEGAIVWCKRHRAFYGESIAGEGCDGCAEWRHDPRCGTKPYDRIVLGLCNADGTPKGIPCWGAGVYVQPSFAQRYHFDSESKACQRCLRNHGVFRCTGTVVIPLQAAAPPLATVK